MIETRTLRDGRRQRHDSSETFHTLSLLQAFHRRNDYRYGALDFFPRGGLSHTEADRAPGPIVRDAHGLEHVGNRDGVGVAGCTGRCGDVIADGGQQAVVFAYQPMHLLQVVSKDGMLEGVGHILEFAPDGAVAEMAFNFHDAFAGVSS